jgi:chromate transporter
VAFLALKLGLTAFGGPAAHIAMLRHEVVERRRWLTDGYFLDLLGATNLIPGPNSTEMVMHVGHERAGRWGLIIAGVCFIAPAALLTLVFAWLYVRFGATPVGSWLLYGIKSAVVAIVTQALWRLGAVAIKGKIHVIGAMVVVILYLLGINELVLLFGGAAALFVLRRIAAEYRAGTWSFALAGPVLPTALLPLAAVAAGVPYSGLRLFLTFLKIGATLYGSGYVLLAFLHNDFVVRYRWLTDDQLLDAVAVGNVTPGPVFSTATFIGYVVGGWLGALLATIGIFLPAFCFVGLTHPLVRRMRQQPALGQLLDDVNVAALGLMAAVTLRLGQEAIVDVPTAAIALVCVALLWRRPVNSVWLIAGGAVLGMVRYLAG